MPILFGEAKASLSQFYGRGGSCPTADGIDLFVREVLQYMLFSEAYGNIRKFCFNAIRGCFTCPPELETPLKIKIDGAVGSVWDKWYEFHDTNILDNCVPAEGAVFEDPNYYPTIYDIPMGGAKVGVTTTCCEADDAHIIIQGKDTTGREIFTFHKGDQIVGEYLSIVKGTMHNTCATFGVVTGVVKTLTKGYTQLYWVKPDKFLKGFLADYAPLEDKPSYRRFQLKINCPESAKISILGRIRLKPYYTDNDYIPFDNLFALRLAAQAVNEIGNRNYQGAAASDQMMGTMISRENQHKDVQPGTPLEVWKPLSGGSIRNVIGGWGIGWGGCRRR